MSEYKKLIESLYKASEEVSTGVKKLFDIFEGSSVDELNSRIDALEAINKRQVNVIMDLETKQKFADGVVFKFGKDTLDLPQQLKALIRERDGIKLAYDVLGKAYIEVSEENRSLKNNLQTSNSCVELLSDEVARLKKETSLQTSLQSILRSDKTKVQIQNLKADLDRSDAFTKGQAREIEELKKHLDTLQHNTNVCFKDVEYYKDQNRELHRKYDDAISNNRYKDDVINQRNSMITGLKKQIADLEAAREAQHIYGGNTDRPHRNYVYSVKDEISSRIEGIGNKAIHAAFGHFTLVMDATVPPGVIIIK